MVDLFVVNGYQVENQFIQHRKSQKTKTMMEISYNKGQLPYKFHSSQTHGRSFLGNRMKCSNRKSYALIISEINQLVDSPLRLSVSCVLNGMFGPRPS